MISIRWKNCEATSTSATRIFRRQLQKSQDLEDLLLFVIPIFEKSREAMSIPTIRISREGLEGPWLRTFIPSRESRERYDRCP